MNSALLVAHLYPSPARPGSGPFVRDEVEYLARQFDVDVIAPMRWLPPGTSRWSAERRIPRYERTNDGVSVWRPRVPALPGGGVSIESRLWPRALGPTIGQISAERTPGLVHAHFGLPDGYAAIVLAKQLGVPSLVTFRGSDALVYPRKSHQRKLLVEVVRGADYLIAVSGGVCDALVALGADRERVRTIVGGVPSTFDPPEHHEARRRVGIEGRRPVVLWAGGFVRVKRPLLAIEAVANMTSDDVELVMAGTGPMLLQAREHARQLGIGDRVRFLGQIDRAALAVWQSAADVFLNSSESEGTPCAVMEAICAGTPIASFPVGGLPDLAARFDAGTTARADTDAALAEAIECELAMKRPRSRLRLAAHKLRENTALRPLVSLYEEALR